MNLRMRSRAFSSEAIDWRQWIGLFTLVAMSATAQNIIPDPKPVPSVQVLPIPEFQAAFERDGSLLGRYYFNPAFNRPFMYPVLGPAGRSLTRMGHPHDPESHSHHNSVWVAHNDVDGVSFWDDRGAGRIVHRRIDRYADGAESASVLSTSDWTRQDGTVLLVERRLTAVHVLPHDEWWLVIDLWLEPRSGAVTLGKTPFGMIGVRMAKTIGVHDGGGLIRNSAGGQNESGVFWQQARWVDYSGPVTLHASEGLTLMDHPDNPNHPSFFHVRDDGWMGASLTFDAPRVLEPGQPLQLRYGLYVHAGVPDIEHLDRQWQRFAATQRADLGFSQE
jgi:hypothetical protein